AVGLPCASIAASTRDITNGRYDRPCTSSSRVQTTCTGLPTAREACAASTATSEKRCARRPKPPPRNAVCTCTFDGSRPSTSATASRSRDCACVPKYRSQPSARASARQLSGSIGACARYGSSYSTSMCLAAPAIAVRTLPVSRATAPGCPARRWYSARNPAVDSALLAPSSQSMDSASRPRFAAKVLLPYTTTPNGSDL